MLYVEVTVAFFFFWCWLSYILCLFICFSNVPAVRMQSRERIADGGMEDGKDEGSSSSAPGCHTGQIETALGYYRIRYLDPNLSRRQRRRSPLYIVHGYDVFFCGCIASIFSHLDLDVKDDRLVRHELHGQGRRAFNRCHLQAPFSSPKHRYR